MYWMVWISLVKLFFTVLCKGSVRSISTTTLEGNFSCKKLWSCDTNLGQLGSQASMLTTVQSWPNPNHKSFFDNFLLLRPSIDLNNINLKFWAHRESNLRPPSGNHKCCHCTKLLPVKRTFFYI